MAEKLDWVAGFERSKGTNIMHVGQLVPQRAIVAPRSGNQYGEVGIGPVHRHDHAGGLVSRESREGTPQRRP